MFLKVPVRSIIEAHKTYEKPVVVCLSRPNGIWDNIENEREEKSIPTFPMPELTVKAAYGLVKYDRVPRDKYDLQQGNYICHF